jgi:hypothetical protein
VEQRDGVSEARLEPPERLRRQRDLGNEHDRCPPARKRRRAGLKVDLGLAAAGFAVEQEVAARRVEAGGDPLERRALLALSGRAAPTHRRAPGDPLAAPALFGASV